jgi:hypothetical protein
MPLTRRVVLHGVAYLGIADRGDVKIAQRSGKILAKTGALARSNLFPTNAPSILWLCYVFTMVTGDTCQTPLTRRHCGRPGSGELGANALTWRPPEIEDVTPLIVCQTFCRRSPTLCPHCDEEEEQWHSCRHGPAMGPSACLVSALPSEEEAL